MLALTLDQAADVRSWFVPDQPGPLVGLHVLNTGHGAFYADRWPGPRAILVESGRNFALAGEPDGLVPDDLQACITLGVVDAPARFDALLEAAFPSLTPWARVILDLATDPVPVDPPAGVTIRRLGPADASDIADLDPKLAWIASTWGGATTLAASGYAWGAFADGQLAAVANSFFVGDLYEDIGVVTAPAYRGRGLSPACTVGLCDDIRRRGHRPTWSTATDNLASQRVAEKLGFGVQHYARLLIVGGPPPEPPQPAPSE